MAEAERPIDIRAVTAVEAPMENEEMEIDLLELLYRLMEKWKLIVIAATLGTILSAVITLFLMVPQYEATAKIYVLNSKDSAVNLSDLQIGSALTTDYQEVFKTWEVHEMVISNLGLPYSYGQMGGMLTVSNPSSTRILYLTVKSKNPKEAAAIANEYASVARKYISDTMVTEQPTNLSIALEPTKPVSPNKTMNILLGFLIGTFLAVATVTIHFLLDDKIKTADDILKYTDMPTLAMVPVAKDGKPKAFRAGRKKE